MKDEKYHSVAGLTKGLALLQALAKQGEGTALRLAETTGIPRPTVHRLLQTLIEAGYVTQPARGGAYRLGDQVRSLADGYKNDDWIFGAASPVLSELRRAIAWPSDVAICMGGAMVVCTSTHDQNPLSLERVVRGRRVSMIATALGKTYLAFCPQSEREAFLESVEPANVHERELLREPDLYRRELHETRERGYGLRIRGVQPKTSSLAVPVMYRDWVVACLNMHWIARALKPEDAVARYLQPLQQAARALEMAYAGYLRENRAVLS